MATPHVAGAAALLKRAAPDLDGPADQVGARADRRSGPHRDRRARCSSIREGGGLVEPRRAPTRRCSSPHPTGLSFGRLARRALGTLAVALTDAGGGAGDWVVTSVVQIRQRARSPPRRRSPSRARSSVTATAGDRRRRRHRLRRADARHRRSAHSVLVRRRRAEARRGRGHSLRAPGSRQGNDERRAGAGRASTAIRRAATSTYPGPERAYRVRITGRPANFGAVVAVRPRRPPRRRSTATSDQLAGYAGLPIDLNPYRGPTASRVPVAGAVLPAAGTYDIVFDTRSAAAAGPVHVPLLGERRHAAAPAARPVDARRDHRRGDRRRLGRRPVVGASMQLDGKHGHADVRSTAGSASRLRRAATRSCCRSATTRRRRTWKTSRRSCRTRPRCACRCASARGLMWNCVLVGMAQTKQVVRGRRRA